MKTITLKELNARFIMHGVCWGLGIYVAAGNYLPFNFIATMVLGFILGVFIYATYRAIFKRDETILR